MTTKHIREMSPEEAAATLASLKMERRTAPPPSDDAQPPKRASDMTPSERFTFLKNHKRKFNL
jgi:hypothetical protein